jgi:hypothetical protein
MTKEIIPWAVFLEALNQRPRARLGEWLARWRFTDEGAFTQLDPAQTATELRRGVADTDVVLGAHQSESSHILN